MKERVVFEANVPLTATLAYADGLKVQGRFGDQVMCSLTDGRVCTCRRWSGTNWSSSVSVRMSRLRSAGPNVARATGGLSTGWYSLMVRQHRPKA